MDVHPERRPSRRQPPRAGMAGKVSHKCSWLEADTHALPLVVADSLTALQVKVKTEQA